jgi:hypothetical protein
MSLPPFKGTMLDLGLERASVQSVLASAGTGSPRLAVFASKASYFSPSDAIGAWGA